MKTNIKLVTFMLVAAIAHVAQATEKPNILFIAIDDMNDRTGFLGGHPQAKAPNMDALAKRGINFTNAHCSTPGCSSSRNALLYGVEPFKSGLYAFYDQAGFSEDLLKPYTAITEAFKDNGYDTYGSGKSIIAAKLPQQDVPIVMVGLEGWSNSVRAGKPRGQKAKK